MGGEPFFGRRQFLTTASDAWQRALNGERQVLLLAGAAGMGKTRLASEIIDSLAMQGASAHWGRAWESGGAPALWPWIQILRGCLAAPAAGRVQEALGDRAALLDQMVMSAHGAADDVPAERSFALFDAIETLLVVASWDQPLVLVVDDLHAADPSSLHLLEFIVRQKSPARLFLIVTMRPAELEGVPRGEETVSAVVREGDLLELAGLADHDVAALARSLDVRVDDDLVATLPTITRGNPLLVRELTRAATAPGVGRPSALTFGTAIHHRVPSAAMLELLRVGATIGRRVPLDLLFDLTGTHQGDGRRDLSRLADEELIAIDPQAEEFAFSHDLIRSSLYEEIPFEMREQLHAQIASALEIRHRRRLQEHADLIAHHYLRAGSSARAKAIEFLQLAGDVSMRRLAYEAAEESFEQALRLTQESTSLRCDLLISLGTAQRRSGRAAADATLTEAALLARELEDGDRLATALIALVSLSTNPYSRLDEHIRLVEHALTSFPPQDTRLKARLLAGLAILLCDPEDDARRAEVVEEALELAGATGDESVMADVLHSAGNTMFYLRTDTHERHLDELLRCVSRLRRGGSPALQLRARELELFARGLRTIVLLEEGEVLAFEREASAVLKGASELGQPIHTLSAECLRSAKDQMVGRMDEIERRSAAFPQLLPDNMLAFVAYFVSTGWALFEQDRLSELRELLVSLLEGMPRLTGVRLLLAMEAIQAGRPIHARRVMAPLVRNIDELPRDAQWLSFVAASSWILKELADHEACARVYHLLLPHRGRHVVIGFGQASLYLGAVDLHLGMAAAGSRDLEAAAQHLEQAIASLDAIGAPAWGARARLELAHVIGTQHRATAQDLARQALEQIDGTTMLFLRRCITQFLDTEHEEASRLPIRAFERDGAVWLVRAFGVEARVKDVRGMDYLKRLIASPGVEMHVTHLAGGGDRGSSVRPEHSDVSSSAMPLLDERAKKEFARRIRDLEEDIEEARANLDDERAARLQAEKDAIVQELRRAVGLWGRSRVFSDGAEKARISVTKAIRRAIALINDPHPELAAHLDAHVMTGTFCSYRPAIADG
jgi:hypothetical protein